MTKTHDMAVILRTSGDFKNIRKAIVSDYQRVIAIS